MAEALTLITEQTTPIGPIEGLAQLALQGATSTAEQGGFTLSKDTEAELRTVFDVDPSAPVLPLSRHGLGCDSGNMGGTRRHAYLLPRFKMATE